MYVCMYIYVYVYVFVTGVIDVAQSVRFRSCFVTGTIGCCRASEGVIISFVSQFFIQLIPNIDTATAMWLARCRNPAPWGLLPLMSSRFKCEPL